MNQLLINWESVPKDVQAQVVESARMSNDRDLWQTRYQAAALAHNRRVRLHLLACEILWTLQVGALIAIAVGLLS